MLTLVKINFYCTNVKVIRAFNYYLNYEKALLLLITFLLRFYFTPEIIFERHREPYAINLAVFEEGK